MVRVKDYEDLSQMLPTEAYQKGATLTWWRPILADPVILELGGREIYRWDYTPSLTEVFAVCQRSGNGRT